MAKKEKKSLLPLPGRSTKETKPIVAYAGIRTLSRFKEKGRFSAQVCLSVTESFAIRHVLGKSSRFYGEPWYSGLLFGINEDGECSPQCDLSEFGVKTAIVVNSEIFGNSRLRNEINVLYSLGAHRFNKVFTIESDGEGLPVVATEDVEHTNAQPYIRSEVFFPEPAVEG